MGELDPGDMICADDFADDLGNLIGQPQQFFAEGREELPTDSNGCVLDPSDPDPIIDVPPITWCDDDGNPIED